MLKRKHFALLLVLTMLATMFVGVGTASAATENVALTIPTVSQSDSGVTLGTLKITETSATMGSLAAGQQITINLPSGVEYDAVPTAATLASYVVADGTYLTAADLGFVAGSNKSLTIALNSRTSTLDRAALSFLFNVAGVSTATIDAPDADIAIEIYAPNTGITQGKVVVARSSSAGTTATVMDDSTVPVGNNKLVGTIRIAENRANSIKAGKQIKIVAPDDITITSAAADCTWANWTPASFNVAKNADGYSQLTLTVNPTAPGTTPGFVNIDLKIDVDDRDLRGPLEFTVKGDNVTTQKLTVGKVADYSIEVLCKGDAKTVKAGFAGQELQKMTIKENLKDSFVNGRDFCLELPSYAHWFAIPTITVEKGNGTFTADQGAKCALDNQRHKLTFTYAAAGAPTKTEFTFEDIKIFLDPDAPEGDLKVIADGKALGGKYEVVLGKVVKPINATASKNDVKIGLANQKAADITITEAAAGMLKYQVTEIANNYDKTALVTTPNVNATLVVDLPDGVKFAKKPTVKVTAGNLKLKDFDIKLAFNDNCLLLPIDKTSSEASTILISDIEYTLDRTVPEGDVIAKLTGNAVDQTLPSDEAVVKVANAVTVTPAPGDYKNEVTFVIGASSYKVNGVEQTMDVAPYIKDSRTYMPIRYVAYALGINDSNILWDGAKQTVTLMKGDKVVQLQVGSTALVINGASVTMDVAPEISNSRTMLPISFVANAFGATASWDAATQTVTIK